MANRHLGEPYMQTLFCWDFNGQKNLDELIEEGFKQFAPEFDDMVL